jgi:hypothetical protein
MRAKLLPAWRGPLARLAESTIGLAVLFAVAQVMGAAHLLRPLPVLFAELAAGLGLWVVAGRLEPRSAAPATAVQPPTRRVPMVERVLAAAAIGVVVVQWTTHVAFALGRGMTHPDTLWYHVPFAAAFVQEHSFTGIESLGYDAARFFPFNAQLLHALGLLAYGRDILSPFLNFAWLALLLLAGWCIGARRGLGHVSIAAMAVVLGLPIMTATQPGQASSDLACAALLTGAIALLVWSDLEPVPVTLAGLAAGMALSTKITIAVAIAALFVGVIVVALRRGHRLSAGLWTASIAITGSFWFIRDWVVARSPLPWFDIRLGPVHFVRQIPPSGVSLAHDVLSPKQWRDVYLGGIWQGFGRAWPIVVVALLGTIAMLLWRRTLILGLVGVVLLAGVVGYLFTPLTGGIGFVFNLRYLSPVLLVAFAAIPLILPERGNGPFVALIACLALVCVGATMPNREQTPAWPSGELLPSIAFVAIAVVAVVTLSRWRSSVAVGSVAIAAILGLLFAQRHYLDHRYTADGLASQPVDAFFRNVHDARVVVFGSDASLPLFGFDLSNHVARADMPAVDVGPSPCTGWRRHLGDHTDYVLMYEHQFGFFEAPPESVIADDPNAHVALRTPEVTVYRMSGPFDPADCPAGS